MSTAWVSTSVSTAASAVAPLAPRRFLETSGASAAASCARSTASLAQSRMPLAQPPAATRPDTGEKARAATSSPLACSVAALVAGASVPAVASADHSATRPSPSPVTRPRPGTRTSALTGLGPAWKVRTTSPPSTVRTHPS